MKVYLFISLSVSLRYIIISRISYLYNWYSQLVLVSLFCRSGRSILPEPGPDAAERDSRTVMVMQVGAHTSERDIEHFFLKVGQVVQTNALILQINFIRALRSRSLRDGSLSHKGRFATFVRSCSALRTSNNNPCTALHPRYK